MNDARQLLLSGQVPAVRTIPIRLREFFAMLQASSEKSISTRELTYSFGWRGSEVQIQRDIHELHQILLAAIDRSLRMTPKSSLIDDIFRGELIYRIYCFECGHVSSKNESFFAALVDVENKSNLYQSLQYQVESEYLVVDNKYVCDKCGKRSDAKRGAAYKKLPRILSIGLKRFLFDFTTFERVKYTKKFTFPLILDMEPFLDLNLKNQITKTKKDAKMVRQEQDCYNDKMRRLAEARRKRVE